MQLTVSTELFRNALSRIGRAANGGTLPILSGVKINAQKGSVELQTTDLELHITAKCEAKVSKPGAIVVGWRLLNSFIGRATAKEATLKLDGEILIVAHGENAANLETLKPEEFPANFDLADGKESTCDAIEFVNPLKAIAHAMSMDESRYVLAGASLKNNQFVSTDGRRLAIYESSIHLDKKLAIIIPSKAVEAMIDIFKLGGEAKLRITSQHLALATADTDFRASLVDGVFPKYETIIPEKHDSAFAASTQELIEAITTASLFLKNKEIAVWIEGQGKEIAIGCYNRFKTKILGTELAGQPKIKKQVNFRFILDALKVLRQDTVRIEVKENDPLVIREGDFLSVIQPLNIEG